MATPPTTTFSTDPALYIFTSLTAGSAHIVTATSRLETILRANKVPFKAVDLATDEKARMLWGRRAGKDPSGRPRKLPGLVQEGMVLGDLTEIDDWNEYGELKQNVKIYYDDYTIPPISQAPKDPAPKPTPPKPAAPPAPPATKPKAEPKPAAPAEKALPVRSIADEVAQRAKEMRTQILREKVYGREGAKAKAAEEAKEAELKEKAGIETPEEAGSKTPPPLTSPLEGEEGEDDESKSGLQSPNTAAWKPTAADERPPLQSPTSTGWRAPAPEAMGSLHGSLVESPSEEEIAAVEKAEVITEDPKEEEEEERRESVSKS